MEGENCQRKRRPGQEVRKLGSEQGNPGRVTENRGRSLGEAAG